MSDLMQRSVVESRLDYAFGMADPARMQSFRMHEVVRLGDADSCVAFRDEWLQLGLTLLRRIGLEAQCVPANDPFFGRRGRLLAATQHHQERGRD